MTKTMWWAGGSVGLVVLVVLAWWALRAWVKYRDRRALRINYSNKRY